MPDLVLGPLLRYADASEATVWVETDVPCEVTVSTGDGGVGLSRTFGVGGHHYALVRMSGLEPGKTYDYEVLLDGALVWPEPGSPFPPSRIRTLGEGEPVKLIFGSCRISAPHEPPHTLGPEDDERGLGVDALYSTAMRLRDEPAGGLPHALVLLGTRSTRTNPPSTPWTLSAPAATRAQPRVRSSRTSWSTPVCTVTPGGTPRSAGSSPRSLPP